jgi:hypothetical protein
VSEESRVKNRRGRTVAVRGVAIVLAAALAASAVQHGLVERAKHRAVIELLADTGLATRQPEAARAVATDPDPVRARLAIARALLAEAIDYHSFSALPPREAAETAGRISERLELAREIAAETLVKRPSAWQAAMILGGATYRLWSSHGDPRTFSQPTTWEAPLRTAASLAPGEDEPLRFLAVAWLEIWPTMTVAERKETLPALHRAFQDPATFARCAGLWFAAAADRDDAFRLVPEDPRAWSVVENLYASKAEWDGFCAARERREAALEHELRGQIAGVAEHIRGGDPSGARSLAGGVLAAAPVELAFRDIAGSALALSPPGPMASPNALRRWLIWADEGLVRGQVRLPPEAVARLASAAGDLPPAEAALSQLAAGNLAQAEVIERRNEVPGTEAWAPYWVAKARVLASRHDANEAAAALARVNRNWRSAVPTLEARLAVAGAARNAAELAEVRADVAAFASASWPATSWRWRGPVARLDLLSAAAAPGFFIGFDQVPASGAVAEVRLDAATVACAPVRSGERIRVAVPVTQGPHLLELESVVGGRVVPGVVELMTAER